MPNWCSNIVEFSGETVPLNRVHWLFTQLEKKEKTENCGQLPDFIQSDTGYFFEIWTVANVLTYETRWSPNTDIVKQVADHFGLGFSHEYAEPMNGIHGRVMYKDGVLQTQFHQLKNFKT
jgi:hypothetical protein